jgi:molybdenum cofactor guanylyltransferase
MGRDKALLEIDGVPLWRRQRDVLAAAGITEIFLSARPEQTWTRGVQGFAGVIHDALPDGGPIVGLTAALERATQPLVAVIAIDLPQLTSTWFDELRSRTSPTLGIVGRHDGHFEPLAAVYPTDFKWTAWEALAKGEFALQRLVSQGVTTGALQVREISAAEARQFTNWNSPSDLEPHA